jgi:uncharacterized membrane protein
MRARARDPTMNAMTPVFAVAAAWAGFLATHVGLAAAPLRTPLVARFGARGFVWLYTAIATAAFSGLVVIYASFAADGPRGLDLAASPAARGVLGALSVAGIALMVAAFAPRAYWDSPIVVLGDGVRAPYGLERITRHPFFAGTATLMGAHALLASRATGAIFFAGFVVLIVAGATHQGRKLRALRGPAYDRFLAATSAVPFVAILRGRQRLVPGELPWAMLALGVAVAIGLRAVHDGIFAWRGAPFAAAAGGGGVLVGVIAGFRERRRATMAG